MAIITAIETPDRYGKFADITSDSTNLKTTKKRLFWRGSRGYGNRIAYGEFSLDGNDYKLPQTTATTPARRYCRL
ncbi:MAG: hypothetical protein ACLUKN_13830 [Bacilli bacterium]